MLVNYSVSFDPSQDQTALLSKLQLSLWSLRQHNTSVPVVVFVYDTVPGALRRICDRYGAEVVERGSYSSRLAGLCPEGWPVLARYPTLHKFLNFGQLAVQQRTLYCDCDTLFADDVAGLFSAYTTADVYAREEVHTTLSRYGPNREFLDEPALVRLAESLGVTFVPPFNTGVVLVNHGRAADLVLLEEWFVSCVWHFMIWMSLVPQHAAETGYGTLDAVEDAHRHATHEQLTRALPYPSANQWIVEEVATWLALGAVPGLTIGQFSPADVPQNGELADPALTRDRWLLCHYFSTDPSTAQAWLPAGQHTASPRS